MNYKEYTRNLIGKKGVLERKEGSWSFVTATSSTNNTLTEVQDDYAVFSDNLKIKRAIPLGILSIRGKGEKIEPEKIIEKI